MRTVYKYIINPDDLVSVSMPEKSMVLSAQMQGGRIAIWALVDTDRPLRDRKFRVIGTGNPIPELLNQLRFIDTVQLEKLGLVFHIFEETL